MRSPDAIRLPSSGDPLAGALQPGDAVGLLGIELPTRRRNRANGRVMASGEHGITLGITQSFGNCPKYIQRRTLLARTDGAAPEPTQRATALDAAPPRWSAAPTPSSSPAERLAM